MARILVVDDEVSIVSVLATLLKAEGYDVVPMRDSQKALELLKSDTFDLMLSDIRMSPVDGMELLRVARAEKPQMAVIMLTAFGTVETALEALKLGAFDYVTKPFKVDELLITVQRALEYKRALTENIDLKAQLVSKYQFDNIVAESTAMRNLCEMIRRVAPTDATVLICGESGTGKEIVAKAIHTHSRRKDKTFLAVNCAALPEPLLESEMFGHTKGAFTGASANKEGLFEAATGGTIFLDEIGAMPLSIQSKLLRVLQEKEVRRVGSNETIAVDCRVLAATNIKLETLLTEGKFREDLYYRISVIPIEIKPLRERTDDILPLIHHFLRLETPQGRDIPTLAPEVRELLEQYPWPGNVRELENAIKHALTFAHDNRITLDVLPPKIISHVSLGKSSIPTQPASDAFIGKSLKAFLREKEKEFLSQVLNKAQGDKEKAAQMLKISLATLYRKLPEGQPKPQ
jgi:two-component system response regulator PilR (NtrC family)